MRMLGIRWCSYEEGLSPFDYFGQIVEKNLRLRPVQEMPER